MIGLERPMAPLKFKDIQGLKYELEWSQKGAKDNWEVRFRGGMTIRVPNEMVVDSFAKDIIKKAQRQQGKWVDVNIQPSGSLGQYELPYQPSEHWGGTQIYFDRYAKPVKTEEEAWYTVWVNRTGTIWEVEDLRTDPRKIIRGKTLDIIQDKETKREIKRWLKSRGVRLGGLKESIDPSKLHVEYEYDRTVAGRPSVTALIIINDPQFSNEEEVIDYDSFAYGPGYGESKEGAQKAAENWANYRMGVLTGKSKRTGLGLGMGVNENFWEGAEPIYSYSRADAIRDGVLVDVTETAKEAGITLPTAVTRAVWEGYVVPDEKARAYGQSEEGRLWDVLYMFRTQAKGIRGDTLLYKLYFVMKERQRRLVTLKAMVGPGDAGEPVLTIMLPDED